MKCALRVREGLGMQVSVALPAIGRLIRRDIRMTVRDTLGRRQGAQEQGVKEPRLRSCTAADAGGAHPSRPRAVFTASQPSAA